MAETIFYPTQKLEVSADADGQRIDNYLMSHLKGVPRSHIYRILRKGEVRVNGGRKKPVYKLQQGDLVRVPPVRIELSDEIPVPKRVYDELAAGILFENEYLIVLNKPSGLAVHSGSEVKYGVIEAMKQHHQNCQRIELVHRIDRATSGCLLLAKDRQTLNALQNSFRHKRMHKAYLAFVKGRMRKATVVDKPLLKQVIGGEGRVVVSTEGKSAYSEFEPLKQYSAGTLVRVTIRTGRTHQIRVHAQSLGQPLAGDERYGDDAFNKACREQELKRLFLHAAELRFSLNGDEYEIQAPLPEALEKFMEKL